MSYADMLLLDAPHRWQFAALAFVARCAHYHAKVYRSRRAAVRAIDTYPNGRAYGMRAVDVDKGVTHHDQLWLRSVLGRGPATDTRDDHRPAAATAPRAAVAVTHRGRRRPAGVPTTDPRARVGCAREAIGA